MDKGLIQKKTKDFTFQEEVAKLQTGNVSHIKTLN